MSDVHEPPELTPQQHATILALLNHPTYAAAAAAVPVDQSTLYRWLKQPAFKAEVRRARQTITDEVVGELCKAARKALATLVDCLEPKYETSSRVRSAAIILTQVFGTQAIANLEADMLEMRARMEARDGAQPVEADGGAGPAPPDGGGPGGPAAGGDDPGPPAGGPDAADDGGGPLA